jgi:hypothetical protein
MRRPPHCPEAVGVEARTAALTDRPRSTGALLSSGFWGLVDHRGVTTMPHRWAVTLGAGVAATALVLPSSWRATCGAGFSGTSLPMSSSTTATAPPRQPPPCPAPRPRRSPRRARSSTTSSMARPSTQTPGSRARAGGCPNNEQECFLPSNVTEGGGLLTITSKADTSAAGSATPPATSTGSRSASPTGPVVNPSQGGGWNGKTGPSSG